MSSKTHEEYERAYEQACNHERDCVRTSQEIRASISHMESTMILMRRALDESLRAEKVATCLAAEALIALNG